MCACVHAYMCVYVHVCAFVCVRERGWGEHRGTKNSQQVNLGGKCTDVLGFRGWDVGGPRGSGEASCAVRRAPERGRVLSPVCSSPPIHMKVQPLNQTALQVSWSRPETIYHPPIMNYMISYSWTKNEDEKEKTFTKDSDKDLVKPPGCVQSPPCS